MPERKRAQLRLQSSSGKIAGAVGGSEKVYSNAIAANHRKNKLTAEQAKEGMRRSGELVDINGE